MYTSFLFLLYYRSISLELNVNKTELDLVFNFLYLKNLYMLLRYATKQVPDLFSNTSCLTILFYDQTWEEFKRQKIKKSEMSIRINLPIISSVLSLHNSSEY